MKTQLLILRNALVILLLSASVLTFGQAKKLPNVVILATGGTIAGAGASSTGSAYTSGQVKIEAMIDAVPNIRTLANLKGEQISKRRFTGHEREGMARPGKTYQRTSGKPLMLMVS